MPAPLFWLDLEMTGLDEAKDQIMEVAAAVTDLDLNMLEEFHQVVHTPDDALAKMDDWCKRTHGASGLVDEVKHGKPLAEVEKDLLKFISRHYADTDRIILTGNSISNDKRFVDRYMPEFAKRLHYRIIDVSSFKEIFKTKFGVSVAKENAHRANEDIHESISELKTYLSYVKVAPGKATDVEKKSP